MWWLLVAAGAAAGAGAGTAWYQRAMRERGVASLPAPPALAARQPALAAALAAAGERATSAGDSTGGIAELARLYHANGHAREAEACWRILHARQPAEATYAYYLADLRRMAGDEAGMVSFLNQTVKLAPDYASAWLILADGELKTGQLDAAARHYRRRLALLPGDAYARLGLARVALQQDRRDEGRRQIEELARDAPGFAPAHNLYAEMLAAQGDGDGANLQRYLGRAAGRFREAADPWLEELRGWCYDPSRLALWASIDDLTNHGDRGVGLLERAIRIAPDDARGYDELGRVLLHAGNPARAQTVFEQGTRLPGAPPGLYAGLSQACLALHQPGPALQAAERGLALAPDAPELQTARGIALQAAGRFAEAAAVFRLTVERQPTVREAHYNLASALLQLGREDEARACLQRALELAPAYPEALLALGRLELKAGRLDSAIEYLRRLHRYYPGSGLARQLLVACCVQRADAASRAGRLDEEERDLSEGLAASPEQPELHGRLGLVLIQRRRLPEAQGELETYLRLDPDEPMASLFLGRLYAQTGRTADARRLLTAGAQLARQAGDRETEELCAQTLQRLPP